MIKKNNTIIIAEVGELSPEKFKSVIGKIAKKNFQKDEFIKI